MYYEYANDFWQKYLKIFVRGGYNSTIETPLKTFQDMEKKGKYKNCNEEDYYEDVENTHDLAKLWGESEKCNLMTLLFRAFQKFNITDATIDKIAELLANDTVHTDFKSIDTGKLYSELVLQDADFVPIEDLEEECDLPPDEFITPGEKEELRELIANKIPRDMKPYLIWRPSDIYDYLNQHIIGQDEAKKAACMLVYNHIRNQSRNIAIAGPTGSGKTEIWRVLAKKFHFIKIVDASNLGAGGWKANMHIVDIFKDLTQVASEHLIIVWDEFDKACEPALGSSGTDYARLLQSEMLRMLDGDTIEFYLDDKTKRTISINCKNISHVFTGSFETMLNRKSERSCSIGFNSSPKQTVTYDTCKPDDLVKYGNVRLEIAGRISRVITLSPMTKDDFMNILSNKNVSPLKSIQKKQGFRLSMDKSTCERLAQDAFDSKMGARYLRSEIQRRIDEHLFENPDNREIDISD